MVQEDAHRETGMDDEMRGRSESRSHDDSSDGTQHPHDLASPPPHLPALTIQRPSNGELPAGRPVPVGGGRGSALGHHGGGDGGAFSPSWDFARSSSNGGPGGPQPNEPSPSHRSRSPGGGSGGGPRSGGSTSPGGGGSRANSPRRPDAASGSGLSFPPSSSFPFAHGSTTDPSGAQGIMSAPPLSRTPNHLSSGSGGGGGPVAYGDPSGSGRVSPGLRGGPPAGLGPQHAHQDGDEERDRFPPRQLPQFDFNQRRHSLANGEASYQSYSPNPHFQQARPPPMMMDTAAGASGGPPPPGAWAAQAALKRKMSHDRSMQPYPDHYTDSNGGSQQGGTDSPTSAGGAHPSQQHQSFASGGPAADLAMEGGPTKRRGSAFDSKMTSLSLSERMSAQGSPFWADGRRDSVASIRSNASYQSSTGYGTGTSTQTSYTGGSELGGPKSYSGGWQPQPGQQHPSTMAHMPSGLPQPAPPSGSGYYAQQGPPPQQQAPHYGPPPGHGSYPPPPPHSTSFPPHPPPHHSQHRPGPLPMHGHQLDGHHPSSQFENYSMGGQPVAPVLSSSASTVAGEREAHSRSQSPTSSTGSPRQSMSAIDQQPQQRVTITKTEHNDGRSRAGSVSSERKGKSAGGGLLAPPEGETPYSRSPELRVSHKLAERKRRKEMKELFDELRDQLPAERGTKSSKWEILSKAVDHITALKETALAKDREIERLRRDLDAMRYPSSSYAPPPPPGPMPPPPTAYSHPYPHAHIQTGGPPQAPSGPPLPPHEPAPPPHQQQQHPGGNGPYPMQSHRPAHPQHHPSQGQQGMPPPAGYPMSQPPPSQGSYHPGPPPPHGHGPRESLPPLQQSRGAYAPHSNSRPLAQEGPHH